MNILELNEKADVKLKEFKLIVIMKHSLILHLIFLEPNYGPLSLRGVAIFFELGVLNRRNTLTEAASPKILISIFSLYFRYCGSFV